MNEVSPSYLILGVHQAVRTAEPHPGVPAARLPEDSVQPRALCHPEPALQPAHPARIPLPLRLLRHLAGDGANMDVHQGGLNSPLTRFSTVSHGSCYPGNPDPHLESCRVCQQVMKMAQLEGGNQACI